MVQQHHHGIIAEIKKEGKIKEKIEKVIEYLIEDALTNKRYTASLIPTIISPQLAPNFWFKFEKSPSENEIYKFLYLLLTGVYKGNYILNLEGISPKLINDFREKLLNKNEIILQRGKESEGISIGAISGKFGIRVQHRYIPEFLLGFLFISYFISWIREKEGEQRVKELIEKFGLPKLIEESGITDEVALVIFVLQRQKKKMYYIPKIKNFISKWYKDFLEGKEEIPSILKFIFSFYILDKNYREISLSLINKFLYYFLQGYVNGELLAKLVELKTSYELKRKGKIYGISNAKQFFSKL